MIDTTDRYATKTTRRYRLRTLLAIVTLVCVSFGTYKTWAVYQSGARDRGFVEGIQLAIDEGPMWIFCGTYYISCDEYEQGKIDGQAYLGRHYDETATIDWYVDETTPKQRHAEIKKRIAADQEIDSRLKAKVLKAIED